MVDICYFSVVLNPAPLVDAPSPLNPDRYTKRGNAGGFLGQHRSDTYDVVNQVGAIKRGHAMLAVLAIIIGLVIALSYAGISNDDEPKTVYAPPMSSVASECTCDKCEWDDYYGDAYDEYCDEFTALFNAIEYKRAKNGRSMVRGPGDKSFKFVAKGK